MCFLDIIVICLQLVQLLCHWFYFGVQFALSSFSVIFERLVFIYQLVTCLLPFIGRLVQLILVDQMLLEEGDANSLVEVNQMVLYLDDILILATTDPRNIDHIGYLHFQVRYQIWDVALPWLFRELVGSLLVYALYIGLDINTLLNQQTECIIAFLHLFGVLLSALLELFLARQVGLIALFHILVHSLQPLLILLHTGLQILFSLFLLFEYGIIVHLLRFFPFFVHLFLNVDDQWILIPYALHTLRLDESISNVIASDSA